MGCGLLDTKSQNIFDVRFSNRVPKSAAPPNATFQDVSKAQPPRFDGHDFTAKLIEHGAPKDFSYHAFRHTVAHSWKMPGTRNGNAV